MRTLSSVSSSWSDIHSSKATEVQWIEPTCEALFNFPSLLWLTIRKVIVDGGGVLFLVTGLNSLTSHT